MAPAFVNNYSPPRTHPDPDPAIVLTSAEPYDINFAFPLHADTLISPLVRLTPFVPRLHARPFWEQAAPHSDALWRYYPFAPQSLTQFFALLERYRQQPECCVFAVFDKTRREIGEGRTSEEDSLAGLMALVKTSASNLTAEIALVQILPAFQRTHVARTAAALLLQYCLQLPNASPCGLGFRRVQWSAHPQNLRSIGLAKRLGMREEAVCRWLWVLPDIEALKKVGYVVKREGGDEEELPGRHSTILAVCWDDWELGARERVRAIIECKSA